MTVGLWILEHSDNERFPYRLQILKGEEPWLTLRVQDRWPAANRNIFCLREKEPPEPGEVLEEIERLPVVALQRRGRRLSVVLDRNRYKRCDFLILTKRYKGRPSEEYEQIFWQTQQSMRQRRPGVRLVTAQSSRNFTVRAASEERYPWRFPGSTIVRGRLPIGDYALIDGNTITAVVERKTFENLLADFLTAKKVHHYTPAFCARAIAELYAAHPGLRIVFCANRKMANEWTRNYFDAVWALAGGSDT